MVMHCMLWLLLSKCSIKVYNFNAPMSCFNSVLYYSYDNFISPLVIHTFVQAANSSYVIFFLLSVHQNVIICLVWWPAHIKKLVTFLCDMHCVFNDTEFVSDILLIGITRECEHHADE